MKVAFVNPPKLYNGKFVEAEDCCWGAVGIRVLPSMLLACASQMENAVYIDLSIEDASALAKAKADVVVYPLAWQYHRETFKKMSVICGRTPQIVLSIPSGYMKEYAFLKPSPFAVVYSEPELVLSLLKDDLVAWRQKTNGLAWVDKLGLYNQNGLNPNCLDNIKGTNYNLVPPRYWRFYAWACYQVTRGCPYRCTFCVWGGSTVTDQNFKMRPADQVAEDMLKIRNHAIDNKVKIFTYLLAAQLTTNLKWIQRFNTLLGHDPIPFQSNVNVFDLTDEKIRLLKESGMTLVSVGIEALTDSLLERINKRHRFEHIIEGLKVLDKHYSHYTCHLRTGIGETLKDIEESKQNVIKLHEVGIKYARFHFGPVIYYKGTQIHDKPPCLLERSPDYSEACFRMKDIPKEWSQVAEVLGKFGLLKHGCGREF